MDRNLKVHLAYMEQAGDPANVVDVDKYCQCIVSAARVVFKGYLRELDVTVPDTLQLTPLLEICRTRHVVLPSHIRSACTLWDEWIRQYKEQELRVPKRKLYAGALMCKLLGECYAEHIARNFILINVKEMEEDDCRINKESGNKTGFERSAVPAEPVSVGKG